MITAQSDQSIKYFVYLRKSTEQKERQALSIPAQKDKLLEKFGTLDVEFVEEMRSAFVAYNRPQFAAMLERIQRKERTGLIAWHPDRLSRNEIDAATITYLVRTGVIEDLKFGTYTFENTPEGVMLLQFALSQSQYESAKKGRDVTRGLEKKASLGIYPAPAPTCYVNAVDPATGYKSIKEDPDRFPLCRKMVELMLTGRYTPPQILKIANEEWGFRTRPSRKHLRGRTLCRSTIYYMFTKPFYCGEYEYPLRSGKWHKATHKPLMAPEEYDRIQALLGSRGKPRPKGRKLTYRAIMRCGECGAGVTAEEKIKRQINGNVHRYVYYHCTKRKDPGCTQRSIEEKDLERQIAAKLGEITIPPSFHAWAMKRLAGDVEKNGHDATRVRAHRQDELADVNERLSRLIEMREALELTRDEFLTRKRVLEKRRASLEALSRKPLPNAADQLEAVDRCLDFAENARAEFADGSPDRKRWIFGRLGSNLLLKDKKLCIDWANELLPLRNIANGATAIDATFEPRGIVMNSAYFEKMYGDRPRMLRALDDIRTACCNALDRGAKFFEL